MVYYSLILNTVNQTNVELGSKIYKRTKLEKTQMRNIKGMKYAKYQNEDELKHEQMKSLVLRR